MTDFGLNNMFDRDGNPIDMDRWGELHLNEDYLRVGLDTAPALEDLATLDDPLDTSEPVATISTVWLGIDHGFLRGGPPIIFETQIFGGPYDQECTRYATEAEAVEGHQRAVEGLRAGHGPWWFEHADAHVGGDDEGDGSGEEGSSS